MLCQWNTGTVNQNKELWYKEQDLTNYNKIIPAAFFQCHPIFKFCALRKPVQGVLSRRWHRRNRPLKGVHAATSVITAATTATLPVIPVLYRLR
jgi:hypothetical protein